MCSAGSSTSTTAPPDTTAPHPLSRNPPGPMHATGRSSWPGDAQTAVRARTADIRSPAAAASCNSPEGKWCIGPFSRSLLSRLCNHGGRDGVGSALSHDRARAPFSHGVAQRFGEPEAVGHLGGEPQPGMRHDAPAVGGYFNLRTRPGSLHFRGALLGWWRTVWITTVRLARRAFSRIQAGPKPALLKDRGKQRIQSLSSRDGYLGVWAAWPLPSSFSLCDTSFGWSASVPKPWSQTR